MFFGKKKKANKDGLQRNCKECDKAISKKWPSNSRENRKIIEARHNEKYPKSRSIKCKKWRLSNPDKAKEGYRKSNIKAMKNLDRYLASILRRRFLLAVKNNQKSGSAVKDLGCSISEFKKYIESKFSPGMSWENRGASGWHFDHIKPLCSFDLSDRDQMKVACHYTNIQPMWAIDNLKKGKSSG